MGLEVEFESQSEGSPAAAASALRALADQIESGVLSASDQQKLPLPAEFQFKIELEEIQRDDGVHHEIEVELKWPIEWKKTITLPTEADL